MDVNSIWVEAISESFSVIKPLLLCIGASLVRWCTEVETTLWNTKLAVIGAKDDATETFIDESRMVVLSSEKNTSSFDWFLLSHHLFQ